MITESDDFDVFLETWEPSALLNYATLDSNLFDPLAQDRLFSDGDNSAIVARTPYAPGPKLITDQELRLRRLSYFERKQKEWSAEFRTRLVDAGLDQEDVATFIESFANDWVDGSSRRQKSPGMMSIKASVRDHDLRYYRQYAGQYVLTPVPDSSVPLFEPEEMRVVFETNCNLLEVCFADYIAELRDSPSGSINHIYLRRGAHMPKIPGEFREELYYLSSYSLAITAAEQFAQTYTRDTKKGGVPCIFSAPLPALQERVVAFSPFILDMDIGQLEFVVAPSIQPTLLHHAGEWSGIKEYQFG